MSPIDRQQEASRLNEIAEDSWYTRGANAALAAYGATVFRRTWRGRRALELGPAAGQMTGILLREFEDVTLVEGAQHFAEALAVTVSGGHRHPLTLRGLQDNREIRRDPHRQRARGRRGPQSVARQRSAVAQSVRTNLRLSAKCTEYSSPSGSPNGPAR